MRLRTTWLLGIVAALLIALGLPVRADATPTQVTPIPLPSGSFNNPYSVQLFVIDENSNFEQGPFTWSLTSGALPSGLTLTSSGLISGNPLATGDFPFSVRATGPAGTIGSAELIHVDLIAPSTTDALTALADQLTNQAGSVLGLTRVATCLLAPGVLQSELQQILNHTPPGYSCP